MFTKTSIMKKSMILAGLFLTFNIFISGCKKEMINLEVVQPESSVIPQDTMRTEASIALISSTGRPGGNISTACNCGTGFPTYRHAMFTFRTNQNQSGEFKLQGGLSNSTGDFANVFITGAILPTIVMQHTPGGSSNKIITVRGSISESAEVTVHVSWLSAAVGGFATGNWSGDLNGNSVWNFPALRCPE